MDRRLFLAQSSAATLGLLLSSCNRKMNYSIYQNSSTQPYTIKHLRGRVGYFTEKGGTIGWMIDQDELVIVDTQFPDQAAHLHQEMLKLTDDTLSILINTHHHGDHTAGNIFFKDKVSKIVAHTNSLANQKANALKNNNMDANLFPNTTFDKEYKVKVGKENIKCHYFGAAHTNGDAIIHFEDSNVVHIGDLVFNRKFPYIDKSAGASIQNWIKVHDQIINTFDNDTIFITGHANTGYDVIITKEDIKAFQNYLEKLMVFGKNAIAAGKSKEETLSKLNTIPGAEQWTGEGISRSIDAVYLELTP